MPDGTTGAVTTATVQLRDQFDNAVVGVGAQLNVGVSGMNAAARLPVTESGGGLYTASYTPTKAGTDLVQVKLDNDAAFDASATSTVVAGPASQAGTVVVNLDETATLLDPSITITIEARDAFGNPVRRPGEAITVTAVLGADRRAVPLAYQENGPNAGLYVGEFEPWEYDEFQVEVAVNGLQIAGSPFAVKKTVF